MHAGKKNAELMDTSSKHHENKLLSFFIYKIVYKIRYDRAFDLFDLAILTISSKTFFFNLLKFIYNHVYSKEPCTNIAAK